MTAFHQMGNDSENLLFVQGLGQFGGAILSPVNYEPVRAKAQIAKIRAELNPSFQTILDPQLYVPQSDRGQLRQWAYFPRDVDTTDLSSFKWWEAVNYALIADAAELEVGCLASPVMLPRGDVFTDAYYSHTVQTCNHLLGAAAGQPFRVMQSAVVGLTLGTL